MCLPACLQSCFDAWPASLTYPGNIMVQRGGRVALLDYGQSKQLPDTLRLQFARLITRLHRCGPSELCVWSGACVFVPVPVPMLVCV